MSQYPSPYPQPPYFQPPLDYSQYYSAGPADLLAPARRAAVLQGVLGALTLVCGVLVGAIPWLIDASRMFAASGVPVPQTPPGMSLQEALRLAFGMLGGCGAAMGVTLLVLAYFVRSGRRAPVMMSIVLSAIVLLVLAIRIVVGLVQLASNPLAALVDLAIALVLAGLFGLNVLWLAAAARNGSALEMAQRQQQAQFFQYQQQHQMYGAPWQSPPPPAPMSPQTPPTPPVPPGANEKAGT